MADGASGAANCETAGRAEAMAGAEWGTEAVAVAVAGAELGTEAETMAGAEWGTEAEAMAGAEWGTEAEATGVGKEKLEAPKGWDAVLATWGEGARAEDFDPIRIRARYVSWDWW